MSGPLTSSRPRVALTIGKFDGVHLGHRQLLARLTAEASARRLPAAAMILHPDPAVVLTGRIVPLLTTVSDRAERMMALGIDLVVPLQFTPALAQLSPTEFLDQLAQRFDLAAVVVGPDFAFGRDRSGDVGTLRAMGVARGFDVVVVPPLEVDGAKIGSRAVRELIAAGDIAAASRLMCAPPRLVGTVVHGAARGRTLGFPTANLALAEPFAVPANGIYTVHATWHHPATGAPGGAGDGLASIGVRPTFDHGPRVVEIFLLDFSGDLYDVALTVDFLARQRGEERFETVDELVEQMHRDVTDARANLAALSGGGGS